MITSKILGKNFSKPTIKEFKYPAFNARYMSLIIKNQKKEYVRDKIHANIGTIGHVDHGKTTLTAAITKYLAGQKMAKYTPYENIDKAPEERDRGITINASILEYKTKKRHYGHTDCPGHADYIKNMIIGSHSLDYGILVVAATDGVMPQTREHLILARQTKIKRLAIFINKVDLADDEMQSLVEMEIQELLTQYGFDPEKCPIIFGSALKALEDSSPEIGMQKIAQLLETIDSFDDPERIEDASPLMPIEQIHALQGKGTIVTGQLQQGTLRKNDDCIIQGHNAEFKTSVVSLETFHKIVDVAKAGDVLGICLKGVKKTQLRRGMILLKPNDMTFANNFDAKVYVLSKEESNSKLPLLHESGSTFFYHTSHINSFVFLPTGPNTFVMQGDSSITNIRLQKKMPLKEGARFTLRVAGKTIGYGVISKILPDCDWLEEEKERKKRKKAAKKAKELEEAEAE